MTDLLAELEKLGITYTIDRNPSPEKVARIRESIAKRDKELKLMQELYAEGGVDKIMECHNSKCNL